MISHLATRVLWFVPLVLQCVIVVIMSLRGLAGKFPFFFCYNLVVPARDVALLYLPYAGTRYSLVYWWGDAGAILLSLGVIVEIIWHLIESYPFLRTVFKIFWIFGIIAAAAALAILHWTRGLFGNQIIESIVLFERSARLLQVCLLIATILLISRLGLTWNNYSVGVAAGFGIYSALDLALLEFRGNLHFITDSAFVLLRSAAYNLAVIIWSVYFLRPRQIRQVVRLPSTDVVHWNDDLSERVNKWYQR
jgi:hypothetical protein